MTVPHRSCHLVSYFTGGLVPWIVQACGFSTASAVGLRRGFHVSTSLWSFACKERDPSRRADIAMESGCKAGVSGALRPSLREEVRTAVQDLDWPPLVSRRWTPSDPVTGGVETDNHGDGASDIKVVSDFAKGKALTVLQWNVLCDGLSGSHPEKGGFVKSPEESLDWDKRRWKILEEMLSWDCDVLALQEVDHHHDWLSPMLAREGYRGLFVKKPLAPGIQHSPTLEDGCSLFYRVKRVSSGEQAGESVEGQHTSTVLELVDAHSFTLAVVENGESHADGGTVTGESPTEGGGTSPVARVQNQVATLALLEVFTGNRSEGPSAGSDAEEGSLVLVATTHLKASKDEHGEWLRAQQATQLLYEVDRFRAGHEARRGLPAGSIPLVIAGDFNATPHASQSGGVTGGGYEPLCYRRVIAHPLKVKSAFPVDGMFTTWKIRPQKCAAAPVPVPGGNTDADGGKAKATVEVEIDTKETKHCIDYVWVSEGVNVVRRSTFPTAEELGPLRVPSFVYPSDHFALAVELRLP